MKTETLLLAHPSPILRAKVLCTFFGKDDTNPEVQELRSLSLNDPLAKELFSLQKRDGSWIMLHPTAIASSCPIIITAMALARLGYLGFTQKDKVVQQGAGFLFSKQKKDGSWPLTSIDYNETNKEKYTWIPLQTALPLRGLVACGYAQDTRCEKAFQWLLDKRLTDGTWPTGWASGNYGYVAGYRKMPHSRWGCRSNTTAVLVCLALHPKMRNSSEAKRSLDLLLGRETKDTQNIGFDLARLLGYETVRGFITFFGKYDPLLTLWLCSKIGAGREDKRVDSVIHFIEEQCTASGLWHYLHRSEASKWVSFEIIRCLRNIPLKGDWYPMEPKTPFQPYPKPQNRF